MNEITLGTAPAPPPPGIVAQTSSAYTGNDGDLNVLLTGQRIQITADVDLAGIARLKEVLGKYEEILKLLGPQNKTQ